MALPMALRASPMGQNHVNVQKVEKMVGKNFILVLLATLVPGTRVPVPGYPGMRGYSQTPFYSTVKWGPRSYSFLPPHHN